MAQIVIRGIPDRIMADLRELAHRRGTSVESEVRALIAEAVEQDAKVRRFVTASRRELRKWRSEGREFRDSTDLVREDRDR